MPKYKSTAANALHAIAVNQPGGLEAYNIVDAIHSANGNEAVLEEIGQEVLSRIGNQQELRAAQANIPELQQVPLLRDPEIYEQQVQQKFVEKWGEYPVMTPPDPHKRRNEIDNRIAGLKQRMQDGYEQDWDALSRKFRQLDADRKEAIAEDRAEVDEFEAVKQEMANDAAEAGLGPVHASRAAHARGVQRLVDAGVVTDGSLITDDAAMADPTDLMGAAARLRRHEESQLDPQSRAMRQANGKDDLRRIIRNTPRIVVVGEGARA